MDEGEFDAPHRQVPDGEPTSLESLTLAWSCRREPATIASLGVPQVIERLE